MTQAINIFLGLVCICIGQLAIAQTTDSSASVSVLPYHQIPEYPREYTATTVAARMVDALGFRYYWATEGLRPEDLTYCPNEAARTTGETLDHIHQLIKIIAQAVGQNPSLAPEKAVPNSFNEKREDTLLRLKEISDLLKASDAEAMEVFDLVFKGDESQTGYPFWNMINGPMADALWHAGQVASFRRASGNPMNPRVDVFLGNLRK